MANLVFLDLDFNDLSGTIPSELFLLTGLTQFDVNNNRLSGNIDQIGVFQRLEFLQIHSNLFTGEIPASMGALARLATFTLHETGFVGAIPAEVCALRDINGGPLSSLIADCGIPIGAVEPEIACDCCTDCRIV